MNNIVSAKLDSRYASTLGVWQYDYGQVLRITGTELPPAVEVQFSLDEKSGETLSRVGTTVDGVTEVKIPDELLTHSATSNYRIYAYIYLTDETSGNTKYEITIPVRVRSRPTSPAEDPETDPDLFRETVVAVNTSAERAKMAEQNAKESATEAGKYAASASESAVTAEKTKEDALRKVGEEKQEAIEAIQNQAAESKGELEQTIINAGVSKEELDESIQTASDTKTALDKSVELAGTAKTELDTSIREAGTAKIALDESTETAGTVQETLSVTVNQAGALDTSLGEKIKTGTQLKTDLVTSGEKAVQDIQAAGSEQLGKMQAVAEAFTADREQIANNKEDIGSLKEDLEEVKDKKITKFYASNQGENHLADSENGKIQDMMICGNSNQNQTKGKNLLKYPYTETTKTSQGITFTDNKDGSINVSGTATETAYYNLYSNSDGKRLTLASGTYKLVAKGRSKCNVFTNNGVNSAKNEGTFTITDGHNDVWCFIEAPKGLAVDETIYPMIQLAYSTDESYEPYTGGKPSPSPNYPQEIKSVVNPVVKVTGKNLYNARAYPLIEKGYNGLTIQKKDDYYTIVGTATAEAVLWLCGGYNNRTPLFMLKKGNYALTSSLTIYSYTGDVRKRFAGIFSNDEDYPVTGICVGYKKGDVLNNQLYVQIEKGSEATSYEPYHEQSVQLPYTLNAIPVASGGNVTIDGQQYIADRVVEKDGVFGIERNIREIHTNTKTMNNSEEYPGWNKVEGVSDVVYYSANPTADSRKLTYISNFTQTSFLQNNKGTNNILYHIKHIIGYSQSELIAKAIDVDMYIRLQDAIFEPLPGDIQAKLRTLVTNYPVTNISVTSDQLDGYTVFNYPISMKNGWDYVKKQLNDNRDYIYDMDAKTQDIDTQSAEAYVNSEYAVALTELEVM